MDFLQKVLVAGATALLVARPLVPGEDSGLLADPSQTADLVLTQLWLVLAACWAGWRLWSRRSDWYAGLADLALLGVVVGMCIAAVRAARYQHPAWLRAGDWVGFLAAFVLLRQLAVNEAEQLGFFAALQASAVALAVQALGQRLGFFPADSHANYRYPDSLAAVLALLIPALLAGVVAARAGKAPRWLIALAAALFALGCLALWCTGSESAVAGTLLVGAIAGLVALRRLRRPRAAGVLIAVMLLLGAAVYFAYATGWLHAESNRAHQTTATLREVWRATGKMLEAAGPWGIGPANFGRVFPRYVGETGELLTAPRNFALDVAASAGPFALLCLGFALATFLSRVVRSSVRGAAAAEEKDGSHGSIAPPLPLASSIRWEFYLGGMLGLIFGSIPRLFDAPAGDTLPAGVAAGVRSLAWFAAFAIYERLPLSARGRALALATGVFALLFALCAADGIAYPSVAGLLWPAVALGLNAAGARPSAWLGRSLLARVLPLPALTAVAMLYFFFLCYPVVASTAAAHRAQVNGRWLLDNARANPRKWSLEDTVQGVERNVLVPLERARQVDHANARLYVHLANWYGQLWGLNSARQQSFINWRNALGMAVAAEKLDPFGTEAPQAKVRLYRLIARVREDQADDMHKNKDEKRERQLRADARKQHELAARDLTRVVENNPCSADWRFQLAQELFAAGDANAGKLAATEALRLDRAATVPARRLTDEQRALLETWLGIAAKG